MSGEIVKHDGATLFRSERVEPFGLAPGVMVSPLLGKHRMGANDQVGVYRLVIDAKCVMPREVHTETQETLIVISGTATVKLEEQDPLDLNGMSAGFGPRPGGTLHLSTIRLVHGDVLTIEPGTMHEVNNDTDFTPFVAYVVASPPF